MADPITVLVVEDEPVTLDVLTRYLKRAGFAVLTATTGEDALTILRAQGAAIDWLFTDIDLPGYIDGWIVGAEFHLSYPLRPVVYASTFARDSRARVAGAICLAKPFSPQEVVEIFRRLSQTAAAVAGSVTEALSLVLPPPRAPAQGEGGGSAEPADAEDGPDGCDRAERRSESRMRSVLRGQIVFNNRFSTMDCVVRDITPHGARLQLAGDHVLPPAFELALPLRNRHIQAEIIWRRGEECGVRFIS